MIRSSDGGLPRRDLVGGSGATQRTAVLPNDFDKAVKVLMSEPARQFIGDLRNCIKADSQYLFFNHLTVRTQIDRLLKENGVSWSPSVAERFDFRALHIALENATKRERFRR